jgi:hypothetical protein
LAHPVVVLLPPFPPQRDRYPSRLIFVLDGRQR